MKITVFTNNQPRHIALIEALSDIADEVFAIQECSTVFPGEIADFFQKSEIMQKYFAHVISAEEQVFGDVRFLPKNVRSISIKSEDLSMVPLEKFGPALSSDYYIVFGSSFIKGPLIDFLVDNSAINIHMGVSPYYRGSSCNFWALYDGNPDLVGATIHMLSRGLDSGGILFHAMPEKGKHDPFVFGMNAVRAAHESVVKAIKAGTLFSSEPLAQDSSDEIRYTRNSEFTDEIAAEYLKIKLSPAGLEEKLNCSSKHLLYNHHELG
ncbi:MAG: methionyl-tRNA formyltransferase [Rhodospirillales bacterium]|jgi:hypothetical protein|nr:methionyl-tRNA formyltransferase [Rhodospirillales bacterium]